MKKVIKYIAVLLAAVVLCTAVLPAVGVESTVTVQAASNKAAAKKAFKKFLANKNELWCDGYYTTDSGVRFRVIDLNKDGTPELLVDTGLGYGLGDASATGLYAYVNGKVKFITSYNNKFSNTYYVNKAGGIQYQIDSSTIYYQSFNGKKVTVKAICSIDMSTGEETYYNAKGKQISKTKYNSIVKKLKKNGTKKNSNSLKMYKNTKKNRRKYL